MQKILKDTNGEAKYKHHNGEMTNVGITEAGLGTKRVRIANLPPEVPDAALTTLLAPFGKVQIIQQEMWTKMYRYPVSNGIRQVTMLTKHIPPHLTLAENRILLSYEGQPTTCYICGETGHMLQNCNERRNKENPNATLQTNSYATNATQKEHNQKHPDTTETTATQRNDTGDKTEQAPKTRTHTDTESTDILMRECRDPSPIATKTKTNTTEKRDDKTTDKRSRKTWAEEGEDEEDINIPELTHEDEDRHKQDIEKTQPGQRTENKELINASEKEDNEMEIVDSAR
jgi:hypothetical protein